MFDGEFEEAVEARLLNVNDTSKYTNMMIM